MSEIELSILNLIPRFENESELNAINRAIKLVKIVETLNYKRFWIGEHHNFKGTVSSANDIIVQQLLQNSKTIRVGAGGVMVPNHHSLQIAERFGTLDVLYPGRVDLGLGRAPGTDTFTAKLLQKGEPTSERFEKTIKELEHYFSDESQQNEVVAYPGVGRDIPLFVLGSSIVSAEIAAKLGLPYAFAGHLAPYYLDEALDIYRRLFKPSHYLSEPYVILSVIGVAATTQEEAEALYQKTLEPALLSQNDPNVQMENYFNELTSAEKLMIESKMGLKIIGNAKKIKSDWQALKEQYQPDELMIVSHLSEIDHLEQSYRIFAETIKNA